MNPTNESIISKIQKLQALADRAGTEAEAASAAQMVADLCQKHNLDIGVVTLTKEETEASEAQNNHTGNMQAHWNSLGWACSELFGVGWYRAKIYTPIKVNGMVTQTKDGTKVVFYGLKASVQAALLTYQYLLASTEAMLEGYIRTGGRPGVSGMRSFRIGCTYRIHEEAEKLRNASRARLQSAPIEVQTETTALIRLENGLMKAHAKKLGLHSGSGFSRPSDHGAYQAGYAAGGRVDLHGARTSRMIGGL